MHKWCIVLLLPLRDYSLNLHDGKPVGREQLLWKVLSRLEQITNGMKSNHFCRTDEKLVWFVYTLLNLEDDGNFWSVDRHIWDLKTL